MKGKKHLKKISQHELKYLLDEDEEEEEEEIIGFYIQKIVPKTENLTRQH